MMGPETILSFQADASEKAAQDRMAPNVLFSEATAFDDIRRAPNLGLHVEDGWTPALKANDPWVYECLGRKARNGSDHYAGHDGDDIRLFCDKGGWGGSGEPALTPGELEVEAIALVRAAIRNGFTLGVGLCEEGQFQVYLRIFVKDPS